MRLPGEAGAEQRVSEFLLGAMPALGFERVAMDANGSVTGEIVGTRAGPTLLFDAHTDTVGIAPGVPWQHAPHGAAIANGRMYGRGSTDMRGALAAMLAKVEAYAARLALIHHVVSVGKDSQIEPASVEAGVVLARWFAREARRIYGSALTGPTADTAADAAAHWLAGQPEGFGTIRDITHGPRRFRSRPASAEEAATKLIREGRAVRYVRPSGDAGGRPADGIRLVVAP